MAKDTADQWTVGRRRVVIMEVILPERIPGEEMAGLIHTALRQKYSDLQSMEYHAVKLADLPLRDL